MTTPGAESGGAGGTQTDPLNPTGSLSSLKTALELVALVGAPVTTAAALLVYFGWIRAEVEADFFGFDPASFGYSTEEHIVRSVGPMIGPLTFGAVVIAIGVSANAWIGHSWGGLYTRHPKIGRLRWLGLPGLILMLLGGLWQWLLGPRHSYVAPLLLAGGALLTAMGAVLTSMLRAAEGERSPVAQPSAALPTAMKLVLAFVLILAAFGFVARRAQVEGFDHARELVSDLDRLPAATIFSEEVLTIGHKGVTCLPVRASRYTRRYVGLHLLTHRNGKYFLILRAYDTNNAIAIILDEAPGLRLELDASPRMRAAAGLGPLGTVPQDPNVLC